MKQGEKISNKTSSVKIKAAVFVIAAAFDLIFGGDVKTQFACPNEDF